MTLCITLEKAIYHTGGDGGDVTHLKNTICFPVHSLVGEIHLPPPNNYPSIELAATVLQLTSALPPSDFSSELNEVAFRFIDQFRKKLPPNVEIHVDEA